MPDQLKLLFEEFPFGPFAMAAMADIQNLVDNNYNPIAPYFDEIMGIDFHAATADFRTSIIRSHFGDRPFRALDLCCGTGLFIRHLKEEFNAEAAGIDMSSGQIRRARKNLSTTPDVKLQIGDVTRVKLPRGIDLVTVNMDALNHIQSRGQWDVLFRKVHDALNPSGMFFFDINLPRRLGSDWNKPEVIIKPNVAYVQIGAEPTRQYPYIWRSTPMIVFTRDSRDRFVLRTAQVRHFSMPADIVIDLLKDCGFAKAEIVKQIGNRPEGHIFNKNRAYFCAFKQG